MNRKDIIQLIINAKKAHTYLEIGVNTGKVLLDIKAPVKIGVDPNFRFKGIYKWGKFFNLLAPKLYEVTSDEFFGKHAENVLKDGVDVAFIDGLHTYEQVYRDVSNTIPYLNSDGYIILHDCNPLNRAAAMPAASIDEVKQKAKDGSVPGWNGNWNGDVWKAVVHLRAARKDLKVFTLDLDFGLGIVTKGSSVPIDIDIAELGRADYDFLDKRRAFLLDLKPPHYLKELLKVE